ncbi:hypothetical protein [Algoriphagus sp. NG3]|uniref:hypothetical protein n=1 Tax=Algoriphagus sp. NG3 TaxID=3097546 RepID=UPI002A80F518|nr:hypothetical protein [Algoriphagus sp. NG3]WPR73747.1 hypothetical protein SLW71_13770 [Algoriphagus sp. NG3]
MNHLESQLYKELLKLSGLSMAFSSLAIGADQLFAKVILKMDVDLGAVIPCSGYEKTFNKSGLKAYCRILEKCKFKEILNFKSPSQEAFFEAGKTIADNSDVLFAIWDGNASKGWGGTADIVRYAIDIQKPIIHMNPWTGEIQTHNYENK